MFSLLSINSLIHIIIYVIQITIQLELKPKELLNHATHTQVWDEFVYSLVSGNNDKIRLNDKNNIITCVGWIWEMSLVIFFAATPIKEWKVDKERRTGKYFLLGRKSWVWNIRFYWNSNNNNRKRNFSWDSLCLYFC